MDKLKNWAVWLLELGLALPILLLLAVFFLANTGEGKRWIESKIEQASDGQVKLSGLSGHLPYDIHIAQLALKDEAGLWLELEALDLQWNPSRLLAGEISLANLSAQHINLSRLPPSSPEAESSSGFSLPVTMVLGNLDITRLDLGEAVAGKPASLAIRGLGRLERGLNGEVQMSLQRLDGIGSYSLQGSYRGGQVQAELSLDEPAQGLIASYAQIEELDALSLHAQASGPLSALQTRLNLSFGHLQAQAIASLDFENEKIQTLSLNATAPAMQPRADIGWKGVTVDAQVQGPFLSPSASGLIKLEGVSASSVSASNVEANLRGDAGKIGLDGKIEGLKLPLSKAELLAASPLALQAELILNQDPKPLNFKLNHPLLNAQGLGEFGEATKLQLNLKLPDLAPLSGLGGVELKGNGELQVDYVQRENQQTAQGSLKMAVNGGQTPLPALLGNGAKLDFAVVMEGENIKLKTLALDGKALDLNAQGSLINQQADFQWNLALSDFGALAQGGSGQVQASGNLNGPLTNFAINAQLDGAFANKDLPRSPITAQLKLQGLPTAPAGQLTARGQLASAPLELSVAATVPADGSVRVNVERAEWKSAKAEGSFNLAQGSQWPVGSLTLAINHLDDLRPLLGNPLTGNLNLQLETSQKGNQALAVAHLQANQAGSGTASVNLTRLELSVTDPFNRPQLDGRLNLDGIDMGSVKGDSALELAGPLDGLGLRLSAKFKAGGQEIPLSGEARLDASKQLLGLNSLQLGWKQQTLRLLEPARVDFAQGLALDRLRLGFAEAELEVAGRITPRLDLSAQLQNVKASLLQSVDHKWEAVGSVRGNARLTGSLERPFGSVELLGEGLQMRTGPGRGLPPAEFRAAAELQGTLAHLDSQVTAGKEFNLSVIGTVPLNAGGQFDLRVVDTMDLKLLDPWLSAEGRRTRGQLGLDLALMGTQKSPDLAGTIRLNKGELQDFNVGAHLSEIEAQLDAQGSNLRFTKFNAKAGSGKITVLGDLDWRKEGMPINLTLNANKARPLASDMITLLVNSHLTLNGTVQEALKLSGSVQVLEAEIRIPERLPTTIAVLRVHRPGEAPPPPPSAQTTASLDLIIDAPNQIFLRGRGVDAELGGKIRLQGTASNPKPSGGFSLRRGEYALAGQTLNFKRGEVGFDGGSLTDPSINFLASTVSGNVTANLAITGTASQPKLTLSSVPEMPQDEVLARLIFGRTASSLSPMELAQIASVLASMSGVTSGMGNPLESVRKGLGLDRLSVGASLEAGRYIAPGVFVGAKQGITSGGSQATVQIDLTRGLKLEGTVGLGGTAAHSNNTSGTTSVGVLYQYEY